MNIIQNEEDLLEEELLAWMATINSNALPYDENNIKVMLVEGGEGPIPHVHIYRNGHFVEDKRNASFVRLDKPNYSPNHKEGRKLSKKEKEQFITIMTTPWPGHYVEIDGKPIRRATGYEGAVDVWESAYGRIFDKDGTKFPRDKDGFLIMPDYSLLETDKKGN